MSDNTRVVIPFGAMSHDTALNITILREDPHASYKAAAGLSSFRRITLENDATLSRAVTLTIPYVDEDGDGYLDGADIPEAELEICWFDESLKCWKPIENCSVDAQANTVTADVVHFTDFAVASLGPAPGVQDDEAEPAAGSSGSSGSGGGGGCFVGTTIR